MLAGAVLSQAERRGDEEFLRFTGETISWHQLADTVARIATLLSGHGVAPGDRVLLAAGNSPTFLYLWFALRWAGATSVPLHTGAPPAAIGRMVDDADIGLVVGDAGLVRRVVDAAPTLADSALGFEDHHALQGRVGAQQPSAPVWQSRFAESSILYTSGTTGPPKGAVLCDEAFMAGGTELARALNLSAEDCIQVGLPLFHTNPQVYAVMTAVATGCSLNLLHRFDAASFLDEAALSGATGFTYVGTVLNLLLNHADRVPAHRLRFCVGGGAPEPVWRAVEENLRVHVHELYGMTETGGWVSATTASHRRVGSCGVVRPDMECAILDPEDHVLGAGSVGQIAVRPSKPGVLFDGYHGRPELTLTRWTNGWFHTGDLGLLDEEGFLYFHGRTDDLIRRSGENIPPADVELVLARHPQILEVAVVGVADEVVGQEVKAVVVPDRGLVVEQLVHYLERELPRFAWPRYLELRKGLPKTPTQKVQRAQLAQSEGETVDLRALLRNRREVS